MVEESCNKKIKLLETSEEELPGTPNSVQFSPVCERDQKNEPHVVTPNRVSHDNVFHRDGTFRDDKVLSKYLHEINSECLVLGGKLTEELEAVGPPYSSKWSNRNHGLFVYASYLWNLVLEKQFFADVPSLKIRKLRNSFVPEMTPYINSGLDLGLLRVFSLRLKQTGLRFFRYDNFYEVPPIIRVLAPSCDILVTSGSHCREFYIQTCLKGVPHGIFMKIFDTFKISQISPLKSSKVVSCATRACVICRCHLF